MSRRNSFGRRGRDHRARQRLLLGRVAPLRDIIVLHAVDAGAVPPMRARELADIGDMRRREARGAAGSRPGGLPASVITSISSSGIVCQSASTASGRSGGRGRRRRRAAWSGGRAREADQLELGMKRRNGKRRGRAPGPSRALGGSPSRACGAVAEWSKALAWKVSIRQKRIEGSNPSRSATCPPVRPGQIGDIAHRRPVVRSGYQPVVDDYAFRLIRGEIARPRNTIIA